MALSGHLDRADGCPLLGVKLTWPGSPFKSNIQSRGQMPLMIHRGGSNSLSDANGSSSTDALEGSAGFKIAGFWHGRVSGRQKGQWVKERCRQPDTI
jgi:hypothetical protein